MTGNDRAIAAAAQRWLSARERRLEIGAEKRRWDKAAKVEDGVLSGAGRHAADAAARLTPAKRVEQAALRALAKACAKERGSRHQIEDAVLVTVTEVLRLS